MSYAIDPELLPWLEMLPQVTLTDQAVLDAARDNIRQLRDLVPEYHPGQPIEITDRTVPGPDGAPEVPIRVYRPTEPAGETRPGLLYIHGGGFVLGDIEFTDGETVKIADEVGAVVVSVDYRLAPEHPFPAGLEDCYAALRWFAAHADELGVDPTRIGVGGSSAGGGLSAGLALLARDRGGPALCFQYLGVPEVDDRLATPSMTAYVDTPLWNRPNAVFSWDSYLRGGPGRGSADVSVYAAPARATDLSGLPPAFVNVCHFDPLRDEGIAYAQAMAQAGVQVELHLYPGTFHGSSAISEAAVTKRMAADVMDALRRGLGVKTA